LYPDGGGVEVEIAGVKGRDKLAALGLSSLLMYTYKKTCLHFDQDGLAGDKSSVWGLLVFALLLAGSPCFSQSVTPESPTAEVSRNEGDLFSQVIANQKRVDADLNTYERIERVEIRKTGSDAKPSEVKVWRVFPAGTGTSKIPLTTEAKPASPESYRAALEKLQTTLIWAAEAGPGQREAYAKVERRKKERNELIDSTRKAFVFTKSGEEVRGDRVLVRYEMTRNPEFKPSTRNEMLFAKVQGTLWVDKETSQLAKIEGHVTEDITLALFLAKVYQGSYFMQERYEVAPGVWLPSYQQYDFDGRKFVVPFSIHERAFYANYRRVGPPKEAVEVVRGELSKLGENRADP
jgi:hypothetical protein